MAGSTVYGQLDLPSHALRRLASWLLAVLPQLPPYCQTSPRIAVRTLESQFFGEMKTSHSETLTLTPLQHQE